MKKILISSIFAALIVLPLGALAITVDIGLGGGAPADAPTLGIMKLLDNIINWLFSILLVVAAICIIIAAYYFVTAQGDADKTKTARNFVLYAVIGVLVAFAARGLVYFVEVVTKGSEVTGGFWPF